MQRAIALVDVNAMYWSCHRVFNPSLEGKAGIVLTNNDGCAVSRNDLAKQLGIKMGEPWFQIKANPKYKDVVAFSSTYALYASMSKRFTNLLAEFSPNQEIYSIDECFLDLTGIPGRQIQRGLEIRYRIKKEVGLPVCVGIGSTKTLAKLANHIAKKFPHFEGVVDLNEWEPHQMVAMFTMLDVGQVWGVGRRYAERLAALDIRSVMDLKLADPEFIRQQFSVVLERTVRELNGEACLDLESVREDKKQIISSRSFGRQIEDLPALVNAVSSFVSRAAEKLRLQNSYAGVISVEVETNRFNPDPNSKYGKRASIRLPAPTDDTLKLNHVAQWILKKIYKPGFRYQRAGIMLDEIVPAGGGQVDLFGYQPAVDKREALSTIVDEINSRMGKNAVRVGTMGFARDWDMKQDLLSPFYTTRIEDIPIAT
jgi:DNA polymerase V